MLHSSRSSPNLAAAARFESMPKHQVSIAAESSDENEARCPVCVESLKDTFRLPGEKPHVTPECGHMLHEVSNRASAS